MLDKEALLKLNRVPDGKPPWLNYTAYRKLQGLFEKLAPPEESKTLGDEDYIRLHAFLAEVAGIKVPESQQAGMRPDRIAPLRAGETHASALPGYGV